MAQFRGGVDALRAFADFFTAARWVTASPEGTTPETWMELVVDFAVATGRPIKATLSLRKCANAAKPQLRQGMSAEHKATELHRQVDLAAKLLKYPLIPAQHRRRVNLLRNQGIRWAAGVGARHALLGGHQTRVAMEALMTDGDQVPRGPSRGKVLQRSQEGGLELKRVKAAAWASRTVLRFPAGKTNLTALGIRLRGRGARPGP